MLSGTRVRELLGRGEPLPEEFTRPEVSEVLGEWSRNGSPAEASSDIAEIEVRPK